MRGLILFREIICIIGQSDKYPGAAGSIPAVNSFRNAYRFANDKANQPLSSEDVAFLEAFQNTFLLLVYLQLESLAL